MAKIDGASMAGSLAMKMAFAMVKTRRPGIARPLEKIYIRLIALAVFANRIGRAQRGFLIGEESGDLANIFVLHLRSDAEHDWIFPFAAFVIAERLLDVIVMLTSQDGIVRTDPDAIIAMTGHAKSGRAGRRTNGSPARSGWFALKIRGDRCAIL